MAPNRTKLELKRIIMTGNTNTGHSPNRTKLELKLIGLVGIAPVGANSQSHQAGIETR